MSKEQTPINIQSELTRLYGLYGWSEMFLYKAQLLFDRELHKKVSEAIQQEREKWKEETKKEVLEALENEFTNYENNNPNKGHIEYYETEVKPKYE